MSESPEILTIARRLVEAELERRMPSETTAPARLHQAMRYAALGPGKRIRPALILASCRALGGSDAAALPAMAAIELLHVYTLVHDDLPAMDDDDLRRGRPTCHKAFDEATAILAGDALQTLAFEYLCELGVEAVRLLARAAGSTGVAGGQQDDLDAEGRKPPWQAQDISLLERIHLRKTAALIRVSCELGGLAAKAPTESMKQLGEFGEAIGLAFQIQDDILDCTASSAALGKTAGKDAAQGKLTWVALHGLESARTHCEHQRQRAIHALKSLGNPAELTALADFIVARNH